MALLLDKYYDAVVVSDETDTNEQGAVRVRIIGITDDLKKNHQPFALPAINSLMAVPTKGTRLRVAFDDGDVNKPKYFNFSPENTSILPRRYKEEYPHVAVANLGGDLFIMHHDRKNSLTEITHPSESALTWDSFGTIMHDSDRGYDNAGLGASQNPPDGRKIHPVLTEATIDIFTCMPVGRGQARQGSEYFAVTHVSQGTVDRINGVGNSDVEPEARPESEGESVTRGEKRQIVNETVDFYPAAETNFEGNPRYVTHILLANTTGAEFVSVSQEIMSGDVPSVHYLVGKKPYQPSKKSDGSDAIDLSAGFMQYVDIGNGALYGSNGTYNGEPANKGAIVILTVGVKAGLSNDEKQFQERTISKIREHVALSFPDIFDSAEDIPIVSYASTT